MSAISVDRQGFPKIGPAGAMKMRLGQIGDKDEEGRRKRRRRRRT